MAAGLLTWSGVDLFFVLSGFLIGGILIDARSSTRYYATFYARRAFRILPLYFLFVSLFLLRHLAGEVLRGAIGGASALTIPWLAYLTFTQTFFMIHNGWYGAAGMAVTWSLAVEEHFYLAAPLLVRRLRDWRLPLALLVTIAAAPLLRIYLRHALLHGDFASYVLMPCRADALCIGILAAWLVRQPGFWNALCRQRALLLSAIGILFAGVAFMTYEGYDQLSVPMTTWGYSWLALFYACCLLMAVSASAGIWQRVLCARWLMWLGTLSYCVYLLHYPLIQSLRRVCAKLLPTHSATAFLLGGGLAIAATLALAALSWRFFESPMLRRGHRFRYFEGTAASPLARQESPRLTVLS
jgi:peptidoglycan/LPS O-acetylase OafA/YrhL